MSRTARRLVPAGLAGLILSAALAGPAAAVAPRDAPPPPPAARVAHAAPVALTGPTASPRDGSAAARVSG